eukprot:353367-Chlamydomonas_euryale.AAC.7
MSMNTHTHITHVESESQAESGLQGADPRGSCIERSKSKGIKPLEQTSICLVWALAVEPLSRCEQTVKAQEVPAATQWCSDHEVLHVMHGKACFTPLQLDMRVNVHSTDHLV